MHYVTDEVCVMFSCEIFICIYERVIKEKHRPCFLGGASVRSVQRGDSCGGSGQGFGMLWDGVVDLLLLRGLWTSGPSNLSQFFLSKCEGNISQMSPEPHVNYLCRHACPHTCV